jgi:hypothetical protein
MPTLNGGSSSWFDVASRLAPASYMPIPTKPPVYNGMIAPRDSWMMPPPCNEMIPPGVIIRPL